MPKLEVMHPLELELQIAVSYLTWWWEPDFRPLQEQCPLLTAELQHSISWCYCFKTYCPQYCKVLGQQASTHMENVHTLEIYQCFNCSVCQGGRGKQRMVNRVGLCPRLWIDGFCFVFFFFAISEDLSLFPNTHEKWLKTSCNSSSRRIHISDFLCHLKPFKYSPPNKPTPKYN